LLFGLAMSHDSSCLALLTTWWFAFLLFLFLIYDIHSITTQVLITGPVDTPYQHGIYLFDVHLHKYPTTAPKVKFLTTDNGRVRFNPNLYNCGKVCLSLLGTWSGPGWISGQSTLLQVLISIQALILVPEPYYNEPGYETQRHQKHVQKASAQYSANIRRQNLSVAILQPLQQVLAGNYIYPEFADVVRQHFVQQSEHLRQQLHEWVQTDPSLQSTVTSIEQQLDQLLQQQQQVLLPPPPAGPPETIELLDDDD
jgi:ubiquitin-protein ligase